MPRLGGQCSGNFLFVLDGAAHRFDLLLRPCQRGSQAVQVGTWGLAKASAVLDERFKDLLQVIYVRVVSGHVALLAGMADMAMATAS